MTQTYWHKKGREFAQEVWDAFQYAGQFLPQDAMQEWFDHNCGSPSAEFENLAYRDVARWALTTEDAREEFARGYREGMSEVSRDPETRMKSLINEVAELLVGYELKQGEVESRNRRIDELIHEARAIQERMRVKEESQA